MEDYLELRDPAMKRQIQRSNKDFRNNKVRSADALLAEVKTLSAKAPQGNLMEEGRGDPGRGRSSRIVGPT
jgi:hypothetical protein